MDFTMPECGGCMTCEIACSYKHTKGFNHLLSSIEIVELEDKPGYKVRITEAGARTRIPCDGCLDEQGEPLCVRYCPKNTELKQIIEAFAAEHLKGKGRD